MKKSYLLALSLLALPVLADNNRGFYLGLGVSSVNDVQEAPIDTTSIRMSEFLVGYKYNDALGIEVRAGSGFKSGMSKDRNIEREINGFQAIYYKPELVNDEAKLYALLGYSKITENVNIDTPLVPALEKVSYSGTSYGVGIGFVINEHFNFNIEYKNPCDDLYNKPNMTSVNIDYRF